MVIGRMVGSFHDPLPIAHYPLPITHYPLPERFCEVYEPDLVSLVAILQGRPAESIK
jgi:hypothetical protein